MTTDTAKQDLAFIKQVVADSRRNAGNLGIHLIVWGILFSIGLIITWAKVQFQFEGVTDWFHWVIIVGAGWLFEFIYTWKVERNRPVLTYADKVASGLWCSFGITLTILGFIGIVSGGISVIYLSPIFSCILAIAFFTSGYVYETRWICYIGIGYWIGASIMFIYPGLYHLIMMAGMTIAFQVIPGFKMKAAWK